MASGDMLVNKSLPSSVILVRAEIRACSRETSAR